jgi:hypothetical protein
MRILERKFSISLVNSRVPRDVGWGRCSLSYIVKAALLIILLSSPENKILRIDISSTKV